MKTEIPDQHRVTQKDVDEAWKLFASGKHEYIALSSGTKTLVQEFIKAGDLQRVSGTWPTLGEVRARITEEEDAYWMRNFGCNAPR